MLYFRKEGKRGGVSLANVLRVGGRREEGGGRERERGLMTHILNIIIHVNMTHLLHSAPTLDASIAARMCSTHISLSNSRSCSGLRLDSLLSFLHFRAKASRRALSLAEQAGGEGGANSVSVVSLVPSSSGTSSLRL